MKQGKQPPDPCQHPPLLPDEAGLSTGQSHLELAFCRERALSSKVVGGSGGRLKPAPRLRSGVAPRWGSGRSPEIFLPFRPPSHGRFSRAVRENRPQGAYPLPDDFLRFPAKIVRRIACFAVKERLYRPEWRTGHRARQLIFKCDCPGRACDGCVRAWRGVLG